MYLPFLFNVNSNKKYFFFVYSGLWWIGGRWVFEQSPSNAWFRTILNAALTVLFIFWFSKEVKLDFWCFFDWFVHGTFEKFSENIFSPNVLRDHSLTQVLVQVPVKYNHTILFIIIWNMQQNIGTPATHVEFTCQ